MSNDARRMLQPYIGRRDLVEAFRMNPLGPYPDELLHMLTILRGVPAEGKFVLIEIEPEREWVLGTLSGKRGVGPDIHEEYRFDNLADAEWAIFRLRWAWWTGEELER